jgi:hypothetical protein
VRLYSGTTVHPRFSMPSPRPIAKTRAYAAKISSVSNVRAKQDSMGGTSIKGALSVLVDAEARAAAGKDHGEGFTPRSCPGNERAAPKDGPLPRSMVAWLGGGDRGAL